MTRNDLRWMIRVFGPQARVLDVENVLRLIAEMGEKLQEAQR